MTGIDAIIYKRVICKYVLLLVIISLISCKNDVADLPDSEKTLEEIYFEDYTSPTELWTFIDKTGKELFKPQYDNLRDFNNGLAIANKKGRWGVIDDKNTIIIPFIYKEITHTPARLFIVKHFNNSYTILNEKSELIQDSLALEQLRSGGIDHFRFKKYGAWGVMDSQLKTIIDPQYSSMSTFKNGHFIAQLNEEEVLLDKYGKEIYRGTQLLWIEPDIILNQNPDNFDIVKINGTEAEFFFTEDGDATYNGNGALMILDRDRYRFYNYQTKLYTASTYTVNEPLGAGLWSIYDQGYLGTLNINKEILHNPTYNVIHPFKNNRAVVGKNDLWGYLDTDGKEIIPMQYFLAWDFHEGMARVFTNEGIAFIDSMGIIVLKGNRKYLEVKDFKDGYARVQKRSNSF